MILMKQFQARGINPVMWLFYILGLCVLVYFYFMRNAHYAVDDSFITYRYALNLKDGDGLVFNIGERFYGTTAPGYAILLAIVTAILQGGYHLMHAPVPVNLDVPQVSVLLSAISLGVIGSMIVLLVRPITSLLKWAVCFGTLLILFIAPPLNELAGHETNPLLAIVFVASILLFLKNRPALAAVIFAIATSFRPEAVAFVGAALLVDWYCSGQALKLFFSERRVLRLLVVYIAIMVVWLAAITCYFGSPIPGSWAANKVQVGLGYWPLFSVPVVGDYVIKSLGVLGSAFVGLGMVFSVFTAFSLQGKNYRLLDNRALAVCLSLALSGLVLALVCLLLSVTFWSWHGLPVVFGLMMAGAAGWIGILELSSDLSDQIRDRSKKFAVSIKIIPVLMLLLLALPTLRQTMAWAHSTNDNTHSHAYDEMADFIKTESPGGAVVQTNEPAALAYRLGSRFKVLDELGLISPGVTQALQRQDINYLLDTGKPDYLICSWKRSNSICDTGVVKDRFELVGTFDKGYWQPALGEGARLFRAVKNADSASIAAIPRIGDVKAVMTGISDIQLGDQWGKVKETSNPGEYFVHPGAKTDTAFTINCEPTCDGLKMYSHIAALPKDAPANVGRIGLKVVTLSGDVVVTRTIIDRQHPLQNVLIHTLDAKLRVNIDNNGDATFDWTIVGIAN